MKTINVAGKNKMEKREWSKPKLINYGRIEDITRATPGPQKGWGAYDGVSLEPQSHHPSL